MDELKLASKSVTTGTGSSMGIWLKDGTTFLTGDGNNLVFASAYQGETKRTLKDVCADGIEDLTITVDEQLIAVTCDNTKQVKLVDAKTGESLYSFSVKDGEYEPKSLAFDPSGRFLAVGLIGSTVIYQISDFKIVREFKNGALGLAWTKDGKRLIGWIYSGAYMFDFPGNKLQYTFDTDSSPSSMYVSPDTKTVTFGTDDGVEVFEIGVNNAQKIINIETATRPVSAMYLPDAQTLLVGDGLRLRAFDADSGQIYALFEGYSTTYDMTLAPGNDVLFMGGTFYWNNDYDLLSDYLASVHKAFFTNAPARERGLAKLDVICNTGVLGRASCLKARQLIETGQTAKNVVLSNWLSGKITDEVFAKSFK